MFNWLTPYAPHILGILRILFGIMMASHGAQKLFGTFGAMPAGVPGYIIWLVGPIEFFGGLLIALGLITRLAAFLMSGLMAVAYFKGHAPGGFFPKVNGGELAVIYCWVSLYLAAQGPGRFAIDNLIRRRKT
ncbi:MAG TPA: DoxX family protein [Thermoanaerobaculia bacterium]|jgi:putative oxidoreductase|nr:DoxX family protein [Thermoanaerobaculia bacterium]